MSKFKQYLEMARLGVEDLRMKNVIQTGWTSVEDAFKHVVKQLKKKGIPKDKVSEKEMIKMIDDAVRVHGHFAHADWKQEVKDLYNDWISK